MKSPDKREVGSSTLPRPISQNLPPCRHSRDGRALDFPRPGSTDDVLQHQPGLGTLYVSGLHEADSRAVELRLLDPRLQTGPFHRLDAIVEGAVWYPDIECSADHLCLVLRLPGEEL